MSVLSHTVQKELSLNQKTKGAGIEKPLFVVQGCLEMDNSRFMFLHTASQTHENWWNFELEEIVGSSCPGTLQSYCETEFNKEKKIIHIIQTVLHVPGSAM